jgi:hypothetical protein
MRKQINAAMNFFKRNRPIVAFFTLMSLEKSKEIEVNIICVENWIDIDQFEAVKAMAFWI